MPNGQKVKLDLPTLEQHFHLPMQEVAKKFGVCMTFFKKVCRGLGIKRWPYRKLKSLQHKIETLQASVKEKAEVGQAKVLAEKIDELKRLNLLRDAAATPDGPHSYAVASDTFDVMRATLEAGALMHRINSSQLGVGGNTTAHAKAEVGHSRGIPAHSVDGRLVVGSVPQVPQTHSAVAVRKSIPSVESAPVPGLVAPLTGGTMRVAGVLPVSMARSPSGKVGEAIPLVGSMASVFGVSPISPERLAQLGLAPSPASAGILLPPGTGPTAAQASIRPVQASITPVQATATAAQVVQAPQAESASRMQLTQDFSPPYPHSAPLQGVHPAHARINPAAYGEQATPASAQVYTGLPGTTTSLTQQVPDSVPSSSEQDAPRLPEDRDRGVKRKGQDDDAETEAETEAGANTLAMLASLAAAQR